MKKKLKVLLVLGTFLLLPFYAFAQEKVLDTEKTLPVTRYFDLKLEHSPQSPFGKTVTFTLYVTPLIDSPKTEILWSSSEALTLTPKHNRFIAMEKGKTYTLKGTLKPKSGGIFNVGASVISWQHDTNYTNSVNETVNFDRDLILQPVSVEYTTSLVLMYIGILLIIGVGIFFIIKLAKKGSEKAKKWLTPPT